MMHGQTLAAYDSLDCYCVTHAGLLSDAQLRTRTHIGGVDTHTYDS
jgi:hypothetical protein